MKLPTHDPDSRGGRHTKHGCTWPCCWPLTAACCLQLDMSPTRMYRGTGLGLSICKVLVEAHGGTLTVSSKVGEGSTFTFTLPVQPPQLPSIHGDGRVSNDGSLLPKPEEGVPRCQTSAARLSLSDCPVHVTYAERLLLRPAGAHVCSVHASSNDCFKLHTASCPGCT